MPLQNNEYQSAHEIGKIYNSLIDKKILCDFFLESVFSFINPSQGLLFLSGLNDQIWLESSIGSSDANPKEIEARAQAVLKEGKPLLTERALFLPLLVRNSVIGAACFLRDSGDFNQKEFDLAFDLASQLAGALKNIFLFEESLKMERLAAVGQTISMVMHELKNIIQIAKLADELTRKGIRDQNQKFLTHGLEGTAKALRDMDGFIWDMLSLTRGFRIEPKKMRVQALLDELYKDLFEKAEQLHTHLDFQVEDSFPEVELDARSFYRVLLNLVQNAIEACDKEESYIRIRVRSVDNDSYQITIEDNGKGMTAEVKAKLFQAFFSTKGHKGNGLGLAIVERTIKEHRGEIHLESEAGKGSVFTIKLPKSIPSDRRDSAR